MTRKENHGIGIRALLLLAYLAVIGATLVGCSVSHQTMRGSVVAMIDNEAHVCIGIGDGLKVGDTLTVYRTREVGLSNLPFVPYRSPGERARSFKYEKVKVGKVVVTRIFDEHYASVEIVNGEIDYPDIVEKQLIP